MKVRVLSYMPQHADLKPGKVYDLADGAGLIASGEAEGVDKGVSAEADPRPAPEEPAAPADAAKA